MSAGPPGGERPHEPPEEPPDHRPDHRPDRGPDERDDEPTGGTLRPTAAGTLLGWLGVGLVVGWLLHPLAERWRGTAPIVTWTQVLALFLMAAVLGAVAVRTWREVHVRHEWLEPHRAVNRLVLARACAVVGALVAGGYLGYAISWIGADAELAAQRGWRSLTAGAGGVAMVAAALGLERACRVRSDPDES